MAQSRTNPGLLLLAALGGGLALALFSGNRRSGANANGSSQSITPPPPPPDGVNILGEGDIPAHDYAGVPFDLGVNLEPEELE